MNIVVPVVVVEAQEFESARGLDPRARSLRLAAQ